jgi:hypothetical protein
MTVGRSGVITFIVFLLVFGLMIQAEKSGDILMRGIIWATILVFSGYALARLWRGRRHSTDYTVGLPQGVRRWLFGESGKP